MAFNGAMTVAAWQSATADNMRCVGGAFGIHGLFARVYELAVGADELIDNCERAHAVRFSNVKGSAVIMCRKVSRNSVFE